MGCNGFDKQSINIAIFLVNNFGRGSIAIDRNNQKCQLREKKMSLGANAQNAAVHKLRKRANGCSLLKEGKYACGESQMRVQIPTNYQMLDGF